MTNLRLRTPGFRSTLSRFIIAATYQGCYEASLRESQIFALQHKMKLYHMQVWNSVIGLFFSNVIFSNIILAMFSLNDKVGLCVLEQALVSWNKAWRKIVTCQS